MAFVRLGVVAGTGTTAGVDTSGASFIAVFRAGQTSTVFDSKGNTWTALTNHATSFTHGRWFYCENPIVGAGHTFSAAASYEAIAAVYYTGQAASPFDVENGDAADPASSLATGSVTPTQDHDLVLAGLATGGVNTSGYGISGGGFSAVLASVDGATGVTYGLAVADAVQTTATAANPTWSWSGASQGVACIAAFKAAAGGGGSTVSAVWTAAGAGAAAWVGGSTRAAALAASGASSVAGVGASTAVAVLSAAGTGAAAWSSNATQPAVWTAAGISSATWPGQATAAAALAATGASSASLTGRSTGAAVWGASGVGLAGFTGRATSAAVLATAGLAAALWRSPSANTDTGDALSGLSGLSFRALRKRL